VIPSGIFLLGVLRSLVELAGLCLLGQGVLYLLAGKAREQNAVYQLLRLLTAPLIGLLRHLVPAALPDRHLPILAFLLLFALWVGLAYLRLQLCANATCPP